MSLLRNATLSRPAASYLQQARPRLQQTPRGLQQRRRWPAASSGGGGGGAGASSPDQQPPEQEPAAFNREGAALATEFAALVNERGGPPPLLRDRRPTHLMSPLACIEAQMEALQHNDYPSTDEGVQTAFHFALPEGAADMLTATLPPQRVRSWAAREEWLALPDFSNQLHSPPFAALLGCDSWRLASPLVFPSQRHTNKAVACVEVVPAAAVGVIQTFSFCLEKQAVGPYKNCWLTVGVRWGDYSG